MSTLSDSSPVFVSYHLGLLLNVYLNCKFEFSLVTSYLLFRLFNLIVKCSADSKCGQQWLFSQQSYLIPYFFECWNLHEYMSLLPFFLGIFSLRSYDHCDSKCVRHNVWFTTANNIGHINWTWDLCAHCSAWSSILYMACYIYPYSSWDLRNKNQSVTVLF